MVGGGGERERGMGLGMLSLEWWYEVREPVDDWGYTKKVLKKK